MKICIVSSAGGHLTEVRELLPAYGKFDHFYVLNKRILVSPDMENRVYFIRHSARDWLFFVNLWEAWKILRREKPQVILSTGPGPVVPFALVGRFLFGAKVLFVETFSRTSSPTLSGRIMYRLADKFFYQSERLGDFFPRGVYGGSMI